MAALRPGHAGRYRRHSADYSIKSLHEFVADYLIWGTVLYHLTVLGEAAVHVPNNVRTRAAMPWNDIRATRNKLVHGYFGTDLEIVWDIVTNDLEPLIPVLEALLASGDNPTKE